MLPLPYSTNAFELTRLVDRASAPLELEGTMARLFLRQIIEAPPSPTEARCAIAINVDERLEVCRIRWCRTPWAEGGHERRFRGVREARREHLPLNSWTRLIP